jgi:hypothetical protein
MNDTDIKMITALMHIIFPVKKLFKVEVTEFIGIYILRTNFKHKAMYFEWKDTTQLE